MLTTWFWLYTGAIVFGLIGHFLLYSILSVRTKYSESPIDNLIVRHCLRPIVWIIVLVVIKFGLAHFGPGKWTNLQQHIISVLLVICVSWLGIGIVNALQGYVEYRFDIGEKDNLNARKIHTQFRVLKHIVTLVICIVAISVILMSFDEARRIGATILASAGIIGIVVGVAAQRTIATVIAGIQIAFTQPIRIDDVVIVENEWGRIEEITLTYVVVKIWDLRRLIVPITYFIEKPFQNWTRHSADLLGTVFIYVDYTVPIDVVREQLRKILEQSEHWDGKVCALQVTNSSEKTVELRALVSAADASTAWSLRCEVREKLIQFLQKHYPQALPRMRVELNQTSS